MGNGWFLPLWVEHGRQPGSRYYSPSEALLSPGELEAEWIFVEATHRRLVFAEACILARNLESRSAIGAAYLRWLLRAFSQPGVTPSASQAMACQTKITRAFPYPSGNS